MRADERLSGVLAAERLQDSLAQYSADGLVYHRAAADPGYKSSFTRDELTFASLKGDPRPLRTALEFSASPPRLGSRFDPQTGEEPGKAHHELPSHVSSGLSTAYNGCDTTAEMLRGFALCADLGDASIIDQYREAIQLGIDYIIRHVNKDGLFVEDPRMCGQNPDDVNRGYALKVTYWKDSELNCPGPREPVYPIVYTLAHFQNAYALARIASVMGDSRLERFSRYMCEAGLDKLRNGDHFVTAIDNFGGGRIIDGPSTDSLHTLLYVSPGMLDEGLARGIEVYSAQLETDVGYRSGIPVVPEVDPYHMQVWAHEQALLNMAARKHDLYDAEGITSRVTPYLMPESGIVPEMIDPTTLQPSGNLVQLWALGAYFYFQNGGLQRY